MEYDRVLLTGDTGFIGSRFKTNWEERGNSIFGLRKYYPGIDLLKSGSIDAVLADLRPDVVVHAAWSASGTEKYRESHIQPLWPAATTALIHKCIEKQIKIVVLGSIAEIEPRDITLYGRARQKLWQASSGLVSHNQVTWLRVHYAFDDSAGRPELLHLLKQGLQDPSDPVPLRSPTARHDFIHVDDVASAISTAISSSLGGLIEVGTGVTRTVAQVAVAMGVHFQALDEPNKASFSTRAAQPTHLLNEGWLPIRTIEFFS